MRKELDLLLCERYSKIFVDRYKPMTETSMYWGFDCGDGWFDLVDRLCDRLQFCTDQHQGPQVVAIQVKEKMGGLRFYVKNANDEQGEMIAMAEAMSTKICDICGKPGTLYRDGWHKTRCDEHRETAL